MHASTRSLLRICIPRSTQATGVAASAQLPPPRCPHDNSPPAWLQHCTQRRVTLVSMVSSQKRPGSHHALCGRHAAERHKQLQSNTSGYSGDCHRNLWHQSTLLGSQGRNVDQGGRHKGTPPQMQQCRPARGLPPSATTPDPERQDRAAARSSTGRPHADAQARGARRAGAP